MHDARYAGVPTFVIDVPTPTTIGLGDSFVGGMVAALELARGGAPATGSRSGGPLTSARSDRS